MNVYEDTQNDDEVSELGSCLELRSRASTMGDGHDSWSLREGSYRRKDSKSSVYVDEHRKSIKSLEQVEEDFEEVIDIEEGKETSDLPKAPDGGYGWVVCAGHFLNQMVFGGLSRSEGLFFLQFQSRFNASAQLTAWPGSLLTTLNLFMGPICGAVVNRYSVRTGLLIGTLLYFIGMVLNGFAPNIYFLFLSHTLLQGLGRGLQSAILQVNLYFDKHRSLATGLGMSGIGIGTFWVVPLTQYLFDAYGFSGAFLILAAVSLHGLLNGMILRPLSMHHKFTQLKLRKQQRKMKNDESPDENVDLKVDNNGNIEKHPNSEDTDDINVDMEPLSTLSNEFSIGSNTEILPERTSQQNLTNKMTNVTDNNNVGVTSLTITSQPSQTNNLSSHDGTYPLLDSSIIDRQHQTEKYSYEEDGCLKSSLKICFPVEFKRRKNASRRTVFNWHLFKHLPFMIFCFGNFLFNLAFRTAFTFLPALAMVNGLTRQEAALVLTISGVADTFGRIAFGFVMDLKPMRPFRPYVFNFLLFIIAAASLLMPSLSTFATFCVVCSIYGFMTGAFLAQKMVVIVDILGRDMMPSALGIIKLFQGCGTLIGPPLAGALRDALGNYNSSFYLGGASMLGSALFLFTSSILLTVKKRKSKS